MVVLSVLCAGGIWLYYKDRFEFAQPLWFWALLLIPVYGIFGLLRGNRQAEVKISSLRFFEASNADWLPTIRPVLFLIRSAALALLILAMARPQSQSKWEDVTTEGIDIVISFDVSASMLAKDFEPDRLEAAKKLGVEFISQRPNDRMGLVVYEGEAFTQCPLTTDHRVLKDLFREVKTGLIEGGTAIGMGLATAVNRLKESDAKSRVVILLTDGVNNAGSIPPLTAAEIAREFGIRVYTIGVGTRGKALSPTAIYPNGQYKYEYVEVDIDENLMQQIADITGGEYFRATDNRKLAEIYQTIDQMEKTRIEVTQHSRKHERFFWFVVIGLGLVGVEYLLRTTLFRMVP